MSKFTIMKDQSINLLMFASVVLFLFHFCNGGIYYVKSNARIDEPNRSGEKTTPGIVVPPVDDNGKLHTISNFMRGCI